MPLVFANIHFKLLDRWKAFWLLTALLLFVLALKPLLGFSFELRDVGALYYGSLDGFLACYRKNTV